MLSSERDEDWKKLIFPFSTANEFPLKWLFCFPIAMLWCWLSFGCVSTVQLPSDITADFSLLISSPTHAKMNFFAVTKNQCSKLRNSGLARRLFFIELTLWSFERSKNCAPEIGDRILFLEHCNRVDSHFQYVEWRSWNKELCRNFWLLFFWVFLLVASPDQPLPMRLHVKKNWFVDSGWV